MTGAGSKPGTAPRMSAKRGGDRHPRCLAGLTVPTASYVATLRGLLERCSWRRRIFSFRLSAKRGARTVWSQQCDRGQGRLGSTRCV